MANGTLIAESLRLATPLRGVALQTTEIVRRSFDDLPPQQPSVWTFVKFTLEDRLAPVLSMTIAAALDDVGGWYCDFHTERETFVVFPRRVFRYPRGEMAGRAKAEAHARGIGIPEAQIDWPE
jgi:hypothetical protein